ncbi:exopolygalacturonase-like [Camellia sinensis]|uniref:exopolygalacturonase-like n=1 Tax=Camellia sinensis TaxID=4442 RepID=UPI001035EE63|nr:exopolygalacturonase-like [Camellia sinensis]
MVMKLSMSAISVLLLLLAQAIETQAAIFDVTKYGANPGCDMSQALLSAWKEACAATSAGKVLIPKGTFPLNEVKIEGPCKAPVEIQLDGTLNAPAQLGIIKGDSWLTIEHIDHLTISGSGTFDDQGAAAWAQNDCGKNPNCKAIPMNLRFNFITNSIVRDVTSKDSKNFHVNVLGCKNFTFQHFTISAPGTSINTDGIHFGDSIGINILDTSIQTGDDCVSIGYGSQQVTVERVTCGPGHGISIGSLGKYPNEDPVIGINVKNCTLPNTMNGVRVKTWPSYPNTSSPAPGIASDMHFEDITMNNVGNPIIIDQEYCPYNQCRLKVPSKVKISNVSFKNIRGSSSTQLAVKLVCSKGTPCENVEISNIDLTYTGKEGPATSLCTNIQPKLSGTHNPPICANSAQAS